ncbi:MAG TPA: NAD(P)/FAD-dependent oxidoreductase [Candidatus Andersenbacteria bacterium]|nr:NAD(P)/FAD-dependent oxidoreductase [Candidatus Andersenbacteria bacterium]
MKKILILGGGFGGIATYQRLHKLIHPANIHNIKIELISNTNYFTYSPMLHEVATGAVDREHVVQPLREILSCCGKDFHQATITGIDPKGKIVHTDQGDHSYDVLLIALGVEQGFFGTPGAEKYALALKWLPGAIAIRNQIINSFEMASEMHDKKNHDAMLSYLNFVIVGGGPTGTELAGQVSDLIQHEMKKFYGDVPTSLAQVSLLHAGTRLLEQLSPHASFEAKKHLYVLHVKTLLRTRVTEVTKNGVILANGKSIASKSVFWTAGTESMLPALLPKNLLTDRGLLAITSTFQVHEYPEIFGIGDCTSISDPTYSYPPTAQAAVQAAELVSYNIIAHINKKPLLHKRYKHKGDIIPIGNGYAIYERNDFIMTGFFAWLLRRIVFLQNMYGWNNRMQILFEWIIGLFLPRDTSQF